MAASTKTPTERLNAFSTWVFSEGGADEQLAAMREFVPAMKAQVEDLHARILPTADECDALSVELGALYDKYAPVRDTARETRNSLGEINDELRDIKAALLPIEAQARLDAFGLDQTTAKPYSAKQINDRAIVALAANEEYLKLDKRDADIEAQARIDAAGLDPTTAKTYTVDQTKDRAIVALAANKDHQNIIERRRVLERQKAGLQAILADADSALSEYRNRNRAMCARLGNLTARLGG